MISFQSDYEKYLESIGVKIMPSIQQTIATIVNATNWDEPETPYDFNNIAVMALIEATISDEVSLRILYLETAFDAIENAGDFPLAIAHHAIIRALLGQSGSAQQSSFSTLLQCITDIAPNPRGLIFLPEPLAIDLNLAIIRLLTAPNSNQQAVLLSAIGLIQSQTIFYNSTGQRFLNLASKFFPESPHISLKQGITLLMGGILDGWVDLHQAVAKSTEDSNILARSRLAIEIAQRDFQRDFGVNIPDLLTITIPFDGLQLAIEPSLRSIVTGVLLGAEDWFETEMEFWRSRLHTGMTVIDVGANAGVYTFSAAQKVGKTGTVIAIEPFGGCVNLLQETCRINELSQVKVCHGAASDRPGKSKLSLKASSELNELSDRDLPEGTYEEVNCFTLDSLIETHQLDRVDFLKIDAEGHEVPVLQGSDRILSQYRPVILYENIAGSQGSNLPVVELLISKGYDLFTYRPFIQQLIPVLELNDLQGSLNVIAVPRAID
ncbi:MAG: FkbM family methyltransferase [Cyanobacteria bacterium]|nr:FkbM family methyltransferase [Cyanobacteriota bacterium]